MARFLLGWELGAGRGHLVCLAAIGRYLAEAGHEVTVAAQRLSGGFGIPDTVAMWQAPVWPRLLANVGALGGPLPNTMGDILHRIGLHDDETLGLIVGGWDAILAAVKPDAVAADFAPALLCAARDRIPTVLVGHAFDTVPSHLHDFPSLTGKPAAHAEEQVLARANVGLKTTGRAPLERLPAIFAADRSFTGTFTELDPYAAWRQTPVVGPSLALPVGQAGGGDEVFVYADAALLRTATLWDGLIRAALPVRVFAQGASTSQQAELAAMGFLVELAPVPFTRIAERSRLVISHGGLGFVSSALAAGVPVVVAHYDLEKALTGQAITRLQLGGHVHAGGIQPEAFATSLRQLYHNESFQRRARELAPGFRARLQPELEELAAQALIKMAG